MNTWKAQRLGVSTILLFGMARLVSIPQQAHADVTSGIESTIRDMLSLNRDTSQYLPIEVDLQRYAQKEGISSQELTRVLVKIMNDGNEFANELAVSVLGLFHCEDAFDDLRDLSRQNGRPLEVRRRAVSSAAAVAGSRLLPYAREIRDSDDCPRSLKEQMYREMRMYLIRSGKIAKEQRDKATESRRAEIVAFLLDSAEKETTPIQVMHLDIVLCEEVLKYDVSAEREGILKRAQTLPETIDLRPEWTPEHRKELREHLREYINKGVETLRRLPPDKRTSVRSIEIKPTP